MTQTRPGSLTSEEVERIAAPGLVKQPRLRAMVLLAIAAGMRPGEIRALRCSDVLECSVRIEHSLRGKGILGPTKDGTVREERLDEDLAGLLRELCRGKDPGTFVFSPDENSGLPVGRWRIEYLFRRICRDAGITPGAIRSRRLGFQSLGGYGRNQRKAESQQETLHQ